MYFFPVRENCRIRVYLPSIQHDNLISCRGRGWFTWTQIMWVIFDLFVMFANFYKLGLHVNACVAFANLQWNVKKHQTSHDLVIVYWKCMFVGSLIITWVPPLLFPSCVHFKCGVVKTFCRCSQISFEHVSLRCVSYDPHVITHQSNIDVQLIKVIERHMHILD